MVDVKVVTGECPMEIEDFSINHKDANLNDFGYMRDFAPEEEDYAYGCGWVGFDSKPPEEKVLDKYNITMGEYLEIVRILKEELDAGPCGWCQ